MRCSEFPREMPLRLAVSREDAPQAQPRRAGEAVGLSLDLGDHAKRLTGDADGVAGAHADARGLRGDRVAVEPRV